MIILMKSEKTKDWKVTTLETFKESMAITQKIIMDMNSKRFNPLEYNEIVALSSLQSGKVIRTPVVDFKLGVSEDALECPYCNAVYITGRGALSRRDNTTDICAACGIVEALDDLKTISNAKLLKV